MSMTAILLLGLVVGLPCTLLAVALLYHARAAAAARMPAAEDGWDPYADEFETAEPTNQYAPAFAELLQDAPETMQYVQPTAPIAPEPAAVQTTAVEPDRYDPTLVTLQQMVSDLQLQLANQRNAVAGLLSERERDLSERATAERVERTTSKPTLTLVPEELAETDLPAAVRQLTAEGLSERAIARRLHIGLEEVRLVARRERVS